MSDIEDGPDSAPQTPGTSTEIEPNERPRCVSVAWHGDQCKNNAKAGQETCAWHSTEYVKRAESRFEPTDDPNKWNVQCKAMVNQPDDTQRRCGKNAVRGLDVCYSHGAGHPAAKEMGERVMQDRVRQHRLKKMADENGIENLDEINPLYELKKIAVEAVAFKDDLREQVIDLQESVYTDRLGIENVRQIVQLYERAIDRTSKLLVEMGRLNLDERLVAISERQGDLISTVLEKVLSRMELGDERREEAKGYLSEEFKKLAIAG